MQHAVAVEHGDVVQRHAHLVQHHQAGHARRPCAEPDDPDILRALARDPQRILGRRRDHDGGAVLIVVKHRNAHPFAADPLDGEAFGRLDVFEIDRPEGWLQPAHQIGKRLGVGLVHLKVKTINPGEFLEQDSLALHHRLGGLRTDIAKAQNRRAVGYYRDEVALGGEAGCGARIFCNCSAGFGHAGRIGARQVAGRGHRLGGADLKFAGARIFMVVQRRAFLDRCLRLVVSHVAFLL